MMAFVVACNSSDPLSGPSGVVGGTTQAAADLPASNPNADLSCSHDAPTMFDVKVDEFVVGRGWKITADMRRTSVNIQRYIVWYQARGGVRRSVTFGARPVDSFYVTEAGIYDFQAQGTCDDGLGRLSAIVTRNVGNSAMPDVEPPPPPPLPPQGCVTTLSCE
jgi:hypothetical protein